MNIPRECFASAARVPIMFTTCDCSRALARHSLATHSQLACDTRASVNLWVSGTVNVHVYILVMLYMKSHVDDHVLHVHVYTVPTMLAELLYPHQDGCTPLHIAVMEHCEKGIVIHYCITVCI